jgi:hypothetical protein
MPKYFWYQAESQSQLLPFPTLLYGQSAAGVWLNGRSFYYQKGAGSSLLSTFALTYGQNQEPPPFVLGRRRFDDSQPVNNAALIPGTTLLTGQSPEIVYPFRRSVVPTRQEVFIPALFAAYLIPGVISLNEAYPTDLDVAATNATGGVLPYSYIYQIALHGSGMWSSRPFSTLASSILDTLAQCTLYDVRLQYTDSSSPAQVVYSNILTVSTTGCGGGLKTQIPDLPVGMFSTGTAVRMN